MRGSAGLRRRRTLGRERSEHPDLSAHPYDPFHPNGTPELSIFPAGEASIANARPTHNDLTRHPFFYNHRNILLLQNVWPVRTTDGYSYTNCFVPDHALQLLYPAPPTLMPRL